MKAKGIIAVLWLFLSAVVVGAQSIQYVTIWADDQTNETVAVETNQIITLAGYDWFEKPEIYVSLALSRGYNDTVIFFHPSTNAAPVQMPQSITGAFQIRLGSGSDFYPSNPTWATFKIETPCQLVNVASNYVPADCVVIPTSATGNVQIILESSSDLVNWTAAMPGTYGVSSATNRFFRVRAVAQ
jgi:hypothetical protein